MATQAATGMERIGRRELGILLGGRLVFNTAFRVVYPLLPFLANGLGVSLQTASLLVTVQVGATLLSPLGGRLADRRGERFALLAGLALLTVGALVCAAARGFGLFLAGYTLVGLGTALFMPAVQAYASNRSDYRERGRILGLLELSWALAALVGVTLLTLLVEGLGGWGAAFGLLAVSGAAMLALTWRLDRGGPMATRARPQVATLGQAEADRAQQRALLAALGFVVVQMFAVELIFVGYGGWLTADFAATTQQLGLVFGLLGFAELAGSMGATLLTDRLGKRRAVLLGFGATGLLMLALPTTAGNWWAFLPLFLLFALCFEFAIVSVYPLVSGLGAGARGAVLALAVASSGMGRIVGSLVGPRLLEGPGFWANGLTAGVAALAGVALGALLLREGQA